MTQPNDNKNQASDVVEFEYWIRQGIYEDSSVTPLAHNALDNLMAAYKDLQAQLTAAQKECDRFKFALQEIMIEHEQHFPAERKMYEIAKQTLQPKPQGEK